MKGERTIVDSPFRYGGIMQNFERDVEEWRDVIGSRCYCCNRIFRNCYSTGGALLRKSYPYVAMFKITKGKYKGKNKFRALCRKCAYDYEKGVIEMDGKTYTDYYKFNEEKYKSENAVE